MPNSLLKQKQLLFVDCLGKFLIYAAERGYKFSLGEGFIRPVRSGVRELKTTSPKVIFFDLLHHSKIMPDGKTIKQLSVHYSALAIDLNLHLYNKEKDEWVYITDGNCEQWKELGEYWKSLDPLCRWGGDFGDGNHISITHEGIK